MKYSWRPVKGFVVKHRRYLHHSSHGNQQHVHDLLRGVGVHVIVSAAWKRPLQGTDHQGTQPCMNSAISQHAACTAVIAGGYNLPVLQRLVISCCSHIHFYELPVLRPAIKHTDVDQQANDVHILNYFPESLVHSLCAGIAAT